MITQSFTFPILATERLTLRQLTISDQQSIFTLRSDPAINKYLNRVPCTTIGDAIQFIAQVNTNIEKGNSLYWAITLTKTNTFVGTVCLYDFSAENNRCEIGFELMTAFQGKGIMKEAINIVMGYAFTTMHFQKIVAYMHKDNERSGKLLMGCEFVLSEGEENVGGDLLIYYRKRVHLPNT